jgi:molecular chaperone GrpE
MNDRDRVEAILDRFREWLCVSFAEAEKPSGLDRFDRDPVNASAATLAPECDEVGIIDLVREFTALRQELKLQTKSGRSLVEQTETTVGALKNAIDQFRAIDARLNQIATAAGKPLAEALADLDEALERGQREIERTRARIATEPVAALQRALDELHRKEPWIRRRMFRRYHSEVVEIVARAGLERDDVFGAFVEGYGLIQKRLKRVMTTEQIERINCEGSVVDPEAMTVIDIVDDRTRPPGTVTKELRRGYTWKGRVLRFAEVQAVRTPGYGAASEGTLGSSTSEANDDEPDDEREAPNTMAGVFLDSD